VIRPMTARCTTGWEDVDWHYSRFLLDVCKRCHSLYMSYFVITFYCYNDYTAFNVGFMDICRCFFFIVVIILFTR